MSDGRQLHLDDLSRWDSDDDIYVMDSAFKFFATFDLRDRYSTEEALRMAFSAMLPDMAYLKDSPLDELLSAALVVSYDSAYAAVSRALGVNKYALMGAMEEWDGMQDIRSDSVSFSEFEQMVRQQEQNFAEWDRARKEAKA